MLESLAASLDRTRRAARSFRTAFQLLRRPTQFLDRRQRDGDFFWMDLPGSPRILVMSNPADVKELFADDGTELHAGPFNRTLSPFLGDQSVLMVDGASHLRKRRLLLPPLHGERMHAYARTMIETTEASMRTWPSGAAFPIHPRMQRITLEVIVKTIFGMSTPSDVANLLGAIEELLRMGAWPPLLVPLFRADLGEHSPWGKFLRQSAILDQALLRDIARCRSEGTAGRTDILALLVDARDEDGRPMPDDEIRDELVTLLVAGHETTATGLAWTIHALLENPAALRRLQEELDGPVDPERYGKLEYLDAVVREGLRLRPIVPFVGRVLQVPRVFAGQRLEAGQGVACSIYLLHRRPELYPEPERFRPERFLERKFTPWEFVPFGGGIRRCIGLAFALYEMKMVLATVVRGKTLTLTKPGHVPVVRRSITFAPKGGIEVTARDR